MVSGLKSAFRNQQSLLVLKAVLYSLFLLFASFAGGGFLSKALFIVVALLLYFNPAFNSGRLFISFAVLSSSAFLIVPKFSYDSVWLGSVAAGILFYILLSLKDLAFVRRDWWHFLLHLSLFYIVFLLFFSEFSNHPVGSLIIFSIIVFSLLGERYRSNLPLSLILVLIITEAAWALGLLPLGFLNSAGALLLVTFVLSDITSSAIKNKLTPKLILSDITVAVMAFLVLFISTGWRI